ncbi:MAG TPA: histidinol-phosphate transaminase [Terriglobales bacterium]|nr:histidinol-phosphate transaminase [Terriglobales bacterium]
MGRFFELINDPARALGAYSSSSIPAHDAHSSLIKLNANESAYGPSPKALAAMREAIERGHLYPDDNAEILRDKLAERYQVRPEQVLVSNGTTALLGVIARTLLRPGLNAVTSECSFISYPMVMQAVGAELLTTPLREGGYDLEAILAAITPETRVVFLANPNNPTGTLVGADAVGHFLERVPPQVITVLDEAYCDYAQHFAVNRKVTYSLSLEHVKYDRNVIVLRTFSKAHGLAGLRVGYGIGPAELIAYLARVQDVFAVSSLAHAAAVAAFDDEAHVRFAVEQNALQLESMLRELSSLGFAVLPTWTNFLSLDVHQDARDFARKLRREGVLVRPLGAWGAPTQIRVTLGTPEQNRFFLDALRRALA